MRIVVAIAALIGGCTVERTIEVTFLQRNEIANGFMCAEGFDAVTGPGAEGPVFIARRLQASGHAALVVDFVSLGGTPSCRPTEVLQWCRARDCEPIAEARRCIELDIDLANIPPAPPGPTGGEAAFALDRAVAALSGDLISADAPSGEMVIVRAVATVQTCEQIAEQGFVRSSLLGCVYSCPVDLDRIEGTLTLDLPTLQLFCEPEVASCAADFTEVSGLTSPDDPAGPPPPGGIGGG